MPNSLASYDRDLESRYPIPTPTTIPAGNPVSHTRLGYRPCTWVRAKRGGWEVARGVWSLVDVFYDDLTGAKETVATVESRDGRISHVRIETWSTGIVPGTSLSRYARA